jgi:S-adenosyl methyltransferase
MDFDDWVPPAIDVDRPSSARVYDYYLGGAYNFGVDRRVAEQAIVVYHEAPLIAQANRAFLRRAVRFLVDVGVRQFLDIGSGIPTMGHVHEIAQRAAPESRVVYVDIDPVAVAHSRDVLAGNDRAAVVQEDIRRPQAILDAPEVRRLLDLGQPVGVLAVAVLHHIADAEDPVDLVARLTEPLASGSYLVISHVTEDGAPAVSQVVEVYRRAGIELTPRSRSQVAALFCQFELVDPGIVWVSQWRPDTPVDRDRPELAANYGGVARKR